MKVLVAQECVTLRGPMDCSPPGSSVLGILQAITGVGCHAFPQGIFLTQGSNPGLLHCRQILYRLSHQGSPCVCVRVRVCVYTQACVLSHFGCVRLFVISCTVASQAPLSTGLSRQEYWSGLPCPPPGELPDPGIEPMSSAAPALQVDSLC